MNVRNLGVVQLSAAERAQVQQSTNTFRKLAGADEVWDHSDVERNREQITDSSFLLKTVNFFDGRAIPGRLHKALEAAGVSRAGSHHRPSTAEGQRAGQQEITRAELDKLQGTAKREFTVSRLEWA